MLISFGAYFAFVGTIGYVEIVTVAIVAILVAFAVYVVWDRARSASKGLPAGDENEKRGLQGWILWVHSCHLDRSLRTSTRRNTLRLRTGRTLGNHLRGCGCGTHVRHIIPVLCAERELNVKSRIKELRARVKLTQEDLAKKIGVRRETILFIEKGNYNPSLKLAHDIAKELQTTIDDLFMFEDT